MNPVASTYIAPVTAVVGGALAAIAVRWSRAAAIPYGSPHFPHPCGSLKPLLRGVWRSIDNSANEQACAKEWL